MFHYPGRTAHVHDMLLKPLPSTYTNSPLPTLLHLVPYYWLLPKLLWAGGGRPLEPPRPRRPSLSIHLGIHRKAHASARRTRASLDVHLNVYTSPWGCCGMTRAFHVASTWCYATRLCDFSFTACASEEHRTYWAVAPYRILRGVSSRKHERECRLLLYPNNN